MSEINYGKIFKTLFYNILLGLASLLFGGFFGGWLGAVIILSLVSYLRICTMTLANPLLGEFSKSFEKFNQKQSINQVLIQDLESVKEEINQLRIDFEMLQNDFEKLAISKQNHKVRFTDCRE